MAIGEGGGTEGGEAGQQAPSSAPRLSGLQPGPPVPSSQLSAESRGLRLQWQNKYVLGTCYGQAPSEHYLVQASEWLFEEEITGPASQMQKQMSEIAQLAS